MSNAVKIIGIILLIIIIIVFIGLIIWVLTRNTTPPVPPTPPAPPCTSDNDCGAGRICIHGVCENKVCNTNQDCLTKSTNPSDSYCNQLANSCSSLSNISCSSDSDCPTITEQITQYYNVSTGRIETDSVRLSTFCYKSAPSTIGFCAYGRTCSATSDCETPPTNFYLAPLNNNPLVQLWQYSAGGKYNDVVSPGDPELNCLSTGTSVKYCSN